MTIKLPPLSRRQLLIASGLSGASMFLPSMLPRSRAQAAAAQPIKRLLVFVQDHGTVRKNWYMMRNNAKLGNWEYPFDDADPNSFSEILRPLHPRRADLLVLDGIAQNSTAGDRATNNHNAGHLHLLSGAKMIDDNNAGGATVDQLIAQQIARTDRIPSIELATTAPWLGGYINSGPSMRVPVETDPAALFQRLFPANFNTSQQPTERDLIHAARGSVLDLVQNEYGLVSPKLSSEDKKKLDMHRQQIRDLETRLSSLANIKCGAPTAPGMGGNRITTTHAFADMIAAAFACDLTRVASISVTQLDNDEFGAPPGDVHQDFAHKTDTDANAAQYMTDYNRVHAEMFAYVLDALRKYPDGNGTLLDSTACIWLTELATGPHALNRIPIVMAGSCGGYFRTGRYVAWAQDQLDPGPFADMGSMVGPGHSRLLVSLMHAFGIKQDSIGMTSTQTRQKPITTLNLTGALDRLT